MVTVESYRAVKQTPEWVAFNYGTDPQRARLDTAISEIKRTGHCLFEPIIKRFEDLSSIGLDGLNSSQQETLKAAEIRLKRLFGPHYGQVIDVWQATQGYREFSDPGS